jgi:hypothetical protein
MAKITNNLLKQAIADAEAVRETAVANAKLVLEEAITPQIRDMIARRLRVEAEMAEEGAVDVEEAKELPHEEGEAEGGADFPADTSAVGTGDNKEPSDAANDESGIGDGGENKEDSHTDWYDDWSESDFDLDEVIKELEEDIAALAEAEHAPEEEKEEEGEEEAKDESWKMKKEVSHDTQDSDVQKFSKAPVVEKQHEEEEENGAEEMEDENINLEAILAELEAEEKEEEGEKHADDDDMGMQKKPGMDKKEVAAHLARLRKELAQHRSVINTLRERLQEVNLLNSKLLFTNKIFRNQGLTNEQRVRIVESFDRATTVREVKLVYAALVENLSTAAKTFAASRKKIVAEGFASKATPSTAPKKEVIVENTVAKRLQELAGII